MAKLGDDVYDWNVEQLADWLRSEKLDDCVESFTYRRIDGLKLLNLTDIDIRNLHVSHESAKKLRKVVEKFKKRKKGKFDRMFGNDSQAHMVTTRKPLSFSHDEEDSDDGWGSDEWESGSGEEDHESSEDDAYVEPEDDLTQPTGSPYKKEPSVFQTGLVAQLREGIAKSLTRDILPPETYQSEEEEEDIYDVPPEEEELETEDLYEEPSDSSGGAVVVRPPAKPPRVENGPAYLQMREKEIQDTYEAPMEGEDISKSPTNKQRFIPTKVQPQMTQQDISSNEIETYDVPEFSSDNEYEVSPQSSEAPPPRPPKIMGKPVSNPSQTQARPPKQQPTPKGSFSSSTPPQKTVYRKPPPSSQAPQDAPNSRGNTFPQQRGPPPKTSSYPQRQQDSSPSQGGALKSPRHLHNKPVGSPLHSSTLPPDPTHKPKPTFSAHGTPFQGIPKQPQPSPKPRPSPLPTEEKRPPLAPKSRPKHADPTKREPAPPPGPELTRKISGPKTGLPDSPKRFEPPRKISDPPSPGRFERKLGDQMPPLPVSTPGPESTRKMSGPKTGLPDSPKKLELPRKISDPPSPGGFERKQFPVSTRPPVPGGREPPPALPPDIPKKGPSGPQNRRSGPLPGAPEPTPSEPAPPPRPPKKGASQGPALPPQRHSHGDKKGVPLPSLPTTSHPSARDSKEQSSGSSLESGSADEPVVPLPSRGRHGGLPPTPIVKSAVEIMREAPWFHGSVDRKTSEANLRAINMDGAFLVRNSTKNPNEYSLSLLYGGQIRHLQIPKKEGQYVLGASGVQKFDNIIDLVKYYRQNEVDLVKGGKTKLTVHAQNISR